MGTPVSARSSRVARWRSMRSSTSCNWYFRFFAQLREQVEAELAGEDVFRNRLEREQVDGLLLQLIDAAFAALAGGFEDVNDGSRNREGGIAGGAARSAMAMAAGCATICGPS